MTSLAMQRWPRPPWPACRKDQADCYAWRQQGDWADWYCKLCWAWAAGTHLGCERHIDRAKQYEAGMWAPEFEPGEAEKRGLVPQFALADARQPPPPGGAAHEQTFPKATADQHRMDEIVRSLHWINERLHSTENTTQDLLQSSRLMNDRMASLENRMESLEVLSDQLSHALQASVDQTSRWVATVNDQQASLETRMDTVESILDENRENRPRLENRVESVEKYMETMERILEENHANPSRLENRIEFVEKYMATIENMCEEELAGNRSRLEYRIECMEKMRHWSYELESAARDLASANDRLTTLENRFGAAAMPMTLSGLESRMEDMELTLDMANASAAKDLDARDQAFTNRMQSIEREMEWRFEYAARNLDAANDRCARLEKRFGPIENLTKEATVLSEQFHTHLGVATNRQISLESRMEKMEKLTQDHQTAREQAYTYEFCANDRMASLEYRMGAIEQLTKNQAQAMETDAEQADYQQASLKHRVEFIEKLTKGEMDATANLEIRVESIEKMTQEQIGNLQSATEQAARHSVWTTVGLENRVKAIEEKLEASLENRLESTEKKLEEQSDGVLENSTGWTKVSHPTLDA